MELILLIGLPGSGKSTFYHNHFGSTHEHESKDSMRGKRNRDRKQRVLLEEAEAAGQSVVLDNTHPSPGSRAPWIAWARAHGWRVQGYYLASKVAECYARNRQRPEEDRVPAVGFYAIVGQLQQPTYADR